MSKSSLESGYHSTQEDEVPQPNMTRIARDQVRFERDYTVEKVLMDSANGRIYTGRDLKRNTKVILKQIPRENCHSWSQFQNHLVPSEIAFHFEAARHDIDEVIVKPLDWLEKKSSFVLVMERIENCVDLFDLIKMYGSLQPETACIIFRQILQMVECLNRAGICHRDIKDENIIISMDTLEVKLIDFGCATTLSSGQVTDFCGTPEFYPPEFWRNRKYTHEGLTTWSLGIVLYILLNGSLPYETVDEVAHFRIESTDHFAKSCKTVQKIFKSLHTFPCIRPSLDQLSDLADQWASTFSA